MLILLMDNPATQYTKQVFAKYGEQLAQEKIDTWTKYGIPRPKTFTIEHEHFPQHESKIITTGIEKRMLKNGIKVECSNISTIKEHSEPVGEYSYDIIIGGTTYIMCQDKPQT